MILILLPILAFILTSVRMYSILQIIPSACVEADMLSAW